MVAAASGLVYGTPSLAVTETLHTFSVIATIGTKGTSRHAVVVTCDLRVQPKNTLSKSVLRT